jgi:hypothetical protein
MLRFAELNLGHQLINTGVRITVDEALYDPDWGGGVSSRGPRGTLCGVAGREPGELGQVFFSSIRQGPAPCTSVLRITIWTLLNPTDHGEAGRTVSSRLPYS